MFRVQYFLLHVRAIKQINKISVTVLVFTTYFDAIIQQETNAKQTNKQINETSWKEHLFFSQVALPTDYQERQL